MQFSRHVTVNWQGTLMEGTGQVQAGTGAFSLPVSFPRRIGEPEGVTSPEELLAAAHGACFSMALAARVGRVGGAMEKAHITCTVTSDKGDAGIKVLTSKMVVVAEGLTGITPEDFPKVAREGFEACPMTNALRAITLELEASVK